MVVESTKSLQCIKIWLQKDMIHSICTLLHGICDKTLKPLHVYQPVTSFFPIGVIWFAVVGCINLQKTPLLHTIFERISIILILYHCCCLFCIDAHYRKHVWCSRFPKASLRISTDMFYCFTCKLFACGWEANLYKKMIILQILVLFCTIRPQKQLSANTSQKWNSRKCQNGSCPTL